MHIPLRKVAYIPTQKTWFSVIITDRRKSHEKPIQHDLPVDALSPAAAECQALCLYLSIYLKCYDAKERERLIDKGLVTASVLKGVDKDDGRVVPFGDRQYPVPVRVMLLVISVLFGCALIWLTIVGLNQAWDLLESAANATKSG